MDQASEKIDTAYLFRVRGASIAVERGAPKCRHNVILFGVSIAIFCQGFFVKMGPDLPRWIISRAFQI